MHEEKKEEELDTKKIEMSERKTDELETMFKKIEDLKTDKTDSNTEELIIQEEIKEETKEETEGHPVQKLLTAEQAVAELKRREQIHIQCANQYQLEENKYKWCLELSEDNDAGDSVSYLKTKLEKINDQRIKTLLNTYYAFKNFGELAVQIQDAQIKQLSNTIIYLKEKYPEIQKEFASNEATISTTSTTEAISTTVK